MQPACPAPTLLISSFFASHECAVHQYYILSPQSFSLLPSIFFFQPRYRMLSFYQHIMVLLITRRGPGREAAQRESWMQKQSREGVMEALCTEMTNQLYIIKKKLTKKEKKRQQISNEKQEKVKCYFISIMPNFWILLALPFPFYLDV